jgi:chaperonin GroES
MHIRPLRDRIIVKRIEAQRTTASGIVIPDSAAEKPEQGEVVAVGPGRRDDKGELIPMEVKAGDLVLFGKYAGQTIKVDGEELLVMREDDDMGVVEREAAALKKAA